MTLSTEPMIRQPQPAAEAQSAVEWLDSLSAGSCDQATFLHGVGAILERAPETGWELLALVDQYYRRGKISSSIFGNVKTHLQTALMGKGSTAEISVPLLRKEDALARPKAVPAASAVRESIKPAPAPAPSPASAVRGSPEQQAGPEQRSSHEQRSTAERSLAVGDILRHRYRVQGLLGQGGMGTVFEAIDQYRLDWPGNDQRVAIKVLHTAVIQRPRLFAELRREFQHLQALSHPNIVRVHEFDRDGDIAFFTMEYLSGALLSRVLAFHASSPLYRPYAFAIIRHIGAAVAYAHSKGVVHGDLNPGNIFITNGGEVRVLDFGASHQLRGGPRISEFENSQQPPVAAPSYASCQLLEGETADARDDVYALGSIIYVLLTGVHPFAERNALEARTSHMKLERPHGLSQRQWHALRSGLAFERERRPADVRVWLDQLGVNRVRTAVPALSSLVTPGPKSKSQVRSMAIGTAAVLLAGCALWWAATHTDTLRQAGALVREKLGPEPEPRLDESTNAAAENSGEAQPPAAPLPPPAPAAAYHAPATTYPTPADPAHPTAAARPAPTVEPAPQPPLRRQSQATGAPSSAHALERNPTTPSASGSADAPPAAAAAPRMAANTGTASAVAAGIAAATRDAPAQTANAVRARIELTADNVQVSAAEQVAQVTVRRSRAMRGDASFSWWTESGTAKPGRDYASVKSQVEHISEGKNSMTLAVPILPDPTRRQSRSFYIVIDAASEDAAVGPRTLTQVTISGSDDGD